MPDFPVYNKCNNNCLMCTNPDNYREAQDQFEPGFLLSRLEKFHRGEEAFLNNYRGSFTLTGGEPTLSADIFDILGHINRLFPQARIAVLTNGRIFCYARYAGKMLNAGANLDLVVSVHGHTAQLHDRITLVPGSFQQTVKGIANIMRLKTGSQALEIRVVIHKQNYKYLKQINEFIAVRFPRIERLVYIFFEAEGRAAANLKQLKLTYTQVRPYIEGLVGQIRLLRQVRFYHFPLCVLPENFYCLSWRTLPAYEITYLKSCAGCRLRPDCPGIPRNYLKYNGAGEFQAIK